MSFEMILENEPCHVRRAESRSEFESFHSPYREHGFSKIGIELVKNRLPDISFSAKSTPGVTPSMTTPTAWPWDSSKVVIRKRCPKLLPGITLFHQNFEYLIEGLLLRKTAEREHKVRLPSVVRFALPVEIEELLPRIAAL